MYFGELKIKLTVSRWTQSEGKGLPGQAHHTWVTEGRKDWRELHGDTQHKTVASGCMGDQGHASFYVPFSYPLVFSKNSAGSRVSSMIR